MWLAIPVERERERERLFVGGWGMCAGNHGAVKELCVAVHVEYPGTSFTMQGANAVEGVGSPELAGSIDTSQRATPAQHLYSVCSQGSVYPSEASLVVDELGIEYQTAYKETHEKISQEYSVAQQKLSESRKEKEEKLALKAQLIARLEELEEEIWNAEDGKATAQRRIKEAEQQHSNLACINKEALSRQHVCESGVYMN